MRCELSKEVTFSVHGDNHEELLHDWLANCCTRFTPAGWCWRSFDVQVGPAGLTATARGEPIDPSRHEIDGEVKAITWHGLKVEQHADGWLAEVIVDV